MTGPHIRRYAPTDLEALYDICLKTGAAGKDATGMLDEPRLLGAVFAAPYGTLEPQHAFVLDDGAGVAAGYVIGAFDSRTFEARCDAAWWPSLRERFPPQDDGRTFDRILIGLIHNPVRAAETVLAEYPSHLHIDLLEPYQSGGWGRRMLDVLFDSLRTAGSAGVHLGVSTANTRAHGFYLHLGFTELHADSITHTMGMRL